MRTPILRTLETALLGGALAAGTAAYAGPEAHAFTGKTPGMETGSEGSDDPGVTSVPELDPTHVGAALVLVVAAGALLRPRPRTERGD